MISLWRRTLEPTDLRVELRDGDIVMGHFDNRKKALDWLWKHVADQEAGITERLSEIADQQVLLVLLQEDVQEMRDFLCATERKFGFPSSNPVTEQPKLKCDECGNPFDDAEGATCQTCLDWVVKG